MRGTFYDPGLSLNVAHDHPVKEENAMAFKRFLHVKLASLFLVPAVAVFALGERVSRGERKHFGYGERHDGRRDSRSDDYGDKIAPCAPSKPFINILQRIFSNSSPLSSVE